MKKVGLKTTLAILGALVALASLIVFRQSGKSMARAQADSPPPSGHGHHRPPGMKGSDLFQYAAPPEGAAAEADVYPPEAPPSTPAPNGVREYTLVVEEDIPHEVAPGVTMPAWTFNRSVPAPVLRATEGDRVRITLVNKGKLPHTIHFHGVHPANMDGVFELVPPGQS
jgi:FtsP/CotA-like multicopper oxidase with cupredoxin domain